MAGVIPGQRMKEKHRAINLGVEAPGSSAMCRS